MNVPTKLSSACFEVRKYGDRTVDVLDIRFLDDDFLCFETELPYLRLGQGLALSQLCDLSVHTKSASSLSMGSTGQDRSSRSSFLFVGVLVCGRQICDDAIFGARNRVDITNRTGALTADWLISQLLFPCRS